MLLLTCAFSKCRYDRKKKKSDWDKTHAHHVLKFGKRVAEAKKAKETQPRVHSDHAFNQYLSWFLENTRIQLLPDAFPDDILKEPLPFDEIGTLEYNRLLRQGRQTSFGPVVSFVVSLVSYVCTYWVNTLSRA